MRGSGGLIFAIHPVLVESVAWVSELKNTLSLALLLPSMLLYIRFVDGSRVSDYIFAALFYGLAVLSKASVVMYPLIILLYVWWKKERIIFRDVLWTTPFFLISLAAGLITMHFQFSRAIHTEVIPVGGFSSRLATAGIAILFYFSKCVFPAGLLPTYPRWDVDPSAPVWFLAWLFIFITFLFLWSKRKTWSRTALLGLGFFVINLLPVLGFITMSYMRFTWVADHFVYLPAIGIIGLIAVGAEGICERVPRYRTSFAIVGFSLLLFLAFTSQSYAKIFSNEVALWTYTLKNNPKAWQAHLRLGKIMIDEGDNEAALLHNAEAVRLRPDLAVAHNNYAVILQITGEHQQAISHLQEAIRLDPKNISCRVTMGDFLIRQGRTEEGRKIYQELLKLMPNNDGLLSKLGTALSDSGRLDEAIPVFQAALAINPQNHDAREQLAGTLEKKKDAEAAVQDQKPVDPD